MGISEAIYKGFKNAYRWSNKVNSTFQIVTTYIRDYIFTIKNLTISIWKSIRKLEHPRRDIGTPPHKGQVYLKLEGQIGLITQLNLTDLEDTTGLCDLRLATRAF